jgi:cytochrome c2
MRQWTGFLLMVCLLAGSAPGIQAAERDDAERGRTIFNGKGICYYCHGMDGRLDQRPKLSKDTTDVIARLASNPPNLADPKGLKLKTDGERFLAIREGHPGTGMLPDTTLTDQEITDTLAFLATLRRK